mmetsp:Transcript_62890/g.128186  ORF Transcript_62890/g.128186 Transcript_62890/m.128186 type:complete len:134 (+) Transcript_62890:100-501(+)
MASFRPLVVLVLTVILSCHALKLQEAPSVYSWWCRDNVICYQGPKEDMADMLNRAVAAPTGVMYTSGLQAGSCPEHGFKLDFIGQTCFGNTFARNYSVDIHMQEESSTSAEFIAKYGESAVKSPGCAACEGHC